MTTPRASDLLSDAYPVIAHIPQGGHVVTAKAWASRRFPNHIAISSEVEELGDTTIEHVSEADMARWCDSGGVRGPTA